MDFLERALGNPRWRCPDPLGPAAAVGTAAGRAAVDMAAAGTGAGAAVAVAVENPQAGWKAQK